MRGLPIKTPQWTPVMLVWEDANGGDAGWEVPDEIKRHGPAIAVSCGLLYKQSEQGVTLMMSIVEELGHTAGYLFVPLKNILKARVLK